MYDNFYRASFLVGIAVSAGVGPLFLFTFNKAITQGFSYGFASGFAIALIDGAFFFASMIGVLIIFEESPILQVALYFIGGVVVIAMGVNMVRKARQRLSLPHDEKSKSPWYTFLQALLLASFNPFAVLFFVVLGLKIFPSNEWEVSATDIFLGSLLVTLGSLMVLTVVSAVASQLGKRLSKTFLSHFMTVSGIIFIIIGCYLLKSGFTELYS